MRHGRPVEGPPPGPVRLTFDGRLVAVAVERDGLLQARDASSPDRSRRTFTEYD